MSAEKTILSKTENKPIVGIPPVLGISPIVIQPQTIAITVQLEHIRVAVGISYVCRAIYATARSIWSWAVFYL